MKYRSLGTTGTKVSVLSLGSWLTYGGYVEEEKALKSIHKAYELGINFFDTANIYRRGGAEKVVGKALKEFSRSSYVLATKLFFPMTDNINAKGLSRKNIIEEADASLLRLQQDYIDLYYAHSFDSETPIEETLRAFDDLVRQGKVLYIGVSSWTATQIAQAVSIADKKLLDRIVVNQPCYNLFDREIEHEIIPVSAQYGIGQVVYSPLAQGVLTGKYKKGEAPPKGSRATDKMGSEMISRFMKDENFERLDKLKEIAISMGVSLPQLALAWVLKNDNVSSAIIGASRPEQIEENVKAVDIEISADIMKEIEEAFE